MEKEEVGYWQGELWVRYWGTGLVVNTKHATSPEKFISINLDVNPQGRVSNIEDHFGCLLFHLRLFLQWLNESISKND